jgi:hypothetical protein
MELYANEELHWHQRSNEKWLLQGDNNTSFFHRVGNGKRRKHTMKSLSENDVIIEGMGNLISHATEYYKDLFELAPRNISAYLWEQHERISVEDSLDLARPLRLERLNMLYSQ